MQWAFCAWLLYWLILDRSTFPAILGFFITMALVLAWLYELLGGRI